MIAFNCINSFKKKTKVDVYYLGLVEYEKAEAIQKDLSCRVRTEDKMFILGLEHPAVISLGRRSNHELIEDNLKAIPVVKSTRGGLVTIHSEGQLVIYPILDLKKLNWGVRQYVLMLLLVTQQLLSEFNIESFIDEQAIGLYTQSGKIAFCGIEIKNGISMHGLSLNICNDLSLFKNITACGTPNIKLDKWVLHQSITPTFEKIVSRWSDIFFSHLS